MTAGEYLTLAMQGLLTVDTILAVGVVAWLQLEQVRVAAVHPSRRIWAEVKWCVLWLIATAVGAPLLVLIAWRPVEVLFLAAVPGGIPGWLSWLLVAAIPCAVVAGALHRGDRLWREVLKVRHEAGFGGVVVVAQSPVDDVSADETHQSENPPFDHAPHSGKVTE